MKKKPVVKIVPKFHKNEWNLFAIYEYNESINNQLRKLKARWSKQNGSWYLPYTQKSLSLVAEALHEIAELDTSEIVFAKSDNKIQASNTQETKNIDISSIKIPEAYIKTLLHRRFSESTYKNYTAQFKRFMAYYAQENLDEITKDQIVDYLIYLIQTKGISTSTQNSVINSIKFYYEKVLNRESQKYWINRPQREFKLPVVLSEQETLSLFGAIDNLKHLTLVSLIYSAGLRRGEVLRIQKGHIDLERKQIKVVKSKGNKDRMTILSDYIIELLKQYVTKYDPQVWLFEGEPGQQYSPSSIAAIIRRASKKAAITKHVTPHVLRHSFATHLMDQGIETRYIQTLLGHNSLETTAIYTHVSTRSIENVKSPLDTLLKKRNDRDKKLED